MLAKFKNLKQYINHGVWGYFYEKEAQPVKRKITGIRVEFYKTNLDLNLNECLVLIENVGWRCPSEVYMTRKEAQQALSASNLKEEIRGYENEIEYFEKTIASNKKYIEEVHCKLQAHSKRLAKINSTTKQNAD